jgi:hypothetical protein
MMKQVEVLNIESEVFLLATVTDDSSQRNQKQLNWQKKCRESFYFLPTIE